MPSIWSQRDEKKRNLNISGIKFYHIFNEKSLYSGEVLRWYLSHWTDIYRRCISNFEKQKQLLMNYWSAPSFFKYTLLRQRYSSYLLVDIKINLITLKSFKKVSTTNDVWRVRNMLHIHLISVQLWNPNSIVI